MRIVVDTGESSPDTCDCCRFKAIGPRVRHGSTVEPFHYVCNAFGVKLVLQNGGMVRRCNECKAAEVPDEMAQDQPR